jgi:splicing factor 3A subunit 1
LFQYFTKLLEQYTKVLIPPKDVMRKLEEESKNEKIIREHVSCIFSSPVKD